MGYIKIGKRFSLPENSYGWKIGLLGRTGSGKTNTAIVFAEGLIENGVPIVILDPQGDWWGLREKYPITILGGDHGDVPLEPTAGTVVAEFVINHRSPVLIDLFGFGEAEMVRFATDFGKTLWKSNREALHVFLDEADLFAPQQTRGGDKAKCLGAWQNIIRRGRSRGIGATMITQRSAVLNKDLLTQADPLLVHRLTASNDLAAVDKYLEYHGYDKPTRREITGQVAKLKVGECLVISPGELGVDPKIVQMNKRKSFDSSAAPKAGATVSGPAKFAEVDLSALQRDMKDSIEKAELNDPKKLRSRIAELERSLSKQAVSNQTQSSAAAVKAAVDQNNREWKSKVKALEATNKNLVTVIKRAQKQLDSANLSIGDPVTPPPPPPTKAVRRAPRSTQNHEPVNNETLPGGHRRILNSLAWWDSIGVSTVPVARVAFVANYKVSGTFNTYLSEMSTNGLIQREPGNVSLTDRGKSVAEPPGEPPTLYEYHEEIKSILKSGPLQKILQSVIDRGPGDSVSVSELAEQTEYQVSGTFNTYLSTLSGLGLIDRNRGMVSASNLLFPEEL